MKYIFILVAFVLALPAQAKTYRFDLTFEGDSVFELHYGFSGESCTSSSDCYPDDFRLANGYFADLTPGQRTTAIVDLDAGTATIADWSVPGEIIPNGGFLANFFSGPPIGSTTFGDERVSVMREGPSGYNESGYCDPSDASPDMPAGFCGFYGYEANFDVVGVTEIPVPAAALLLLSAFGLLGFARKKRLT